MVVAVLLLALSACSGGTSDAEDEACNSIHAWESGGGQADRFDQAAAVAHEQLADSDHDSLIAAADELGHGTEQDRSASVESFLARCRDLGWEPAEG